MKTGLLAIALSASALLGGCSDVNERIERMKRSKVANACIDLTIDRLRSPSSFLLIDIKDEEYRFGQSIEVEFEAANGFGAMGLGYAFCLSNMNGLLIEATIDGEFLDWDQMTEVVGEDRVVGRDGNLREEAVNRHNEFR